MKNKPLSEEMQRCLDYIKSHEGYIHRHTGGYWAHRNWKHSANNYPYPEGKSFSTLTVQALVTRGLLAYVGRVQSGPGYGQPQGAKLVT